MVESNTNKPDAQMSEQPKSGANLGQTTTAEQEAKHKQQIQTCIKQFILQLKNGCNKTFCFNKYCKKNVFGKFEQNGSLRFCTEGDSLKFDNDREMLTFAL